MFLTCGTSNSWNEMLNRLLMGLSRMKSRLPVLTISGSLRRPGTIRKVNAESINPPWKVSISVWYRFQPFIVSVCVNTTLMKRTYMAVQTSSKVPPAMKLNLYSIRFIREPLR